LEKPVLTLCNIVVVDEVARPRVLTEFAVLVGRTPYVVLLRLDWADVRRPRLGYTSEKDCRGIV
jgi:predicted amino acid racemase